MSAVRRSIRLAALAACVLVLAACAPGPSPEELRDRAEVVFDALVAELAEVEPTVLRTVEVVPVTEEACGEDDSGVQEAFVATATSSVQATDDAVRNLAGTLADQLDPEDWDRIRSPETGQEAWAAEDGVVVTTTLAGPALVVAVFTPCRA